MYTLSAQTENRNLADTQRRLEDARELLVAFAMVNGRLPCPARYTSSASHSSGLESFCVAGTGTCVGTETTTVQTHGNCSNFNDGFLPAASIGWTPTDSSGFALDPWGNRIRYAVASKTANPTGSASCQTTAGAPLTGQKYLYTKTRASGESLIGCVPDEMVVCTTAATIVGTQCNAVATVNNVVDKNIVVAVVFSTGRNYITASTAAAATTAGRTDEAENIDGDGIFVWHTPVASSEVNEFDDQMLWLPAPLLYSKLIAAGVLP